MKMPGECDDATCNGLSQFSIEFMQGVCPNRVCCYHECIIRYAKHPGNKKV